jgi:hypothetical protein
MAYGRAIRERASHLLEAHGDCALEEARLAAADPAIPAAEQSFWHAVADRVARMTARATGVTVPIDA